MNAPAPAAGLDDLLGLAVAPDHLTFFQMSLRAVSRKRASSLYT